MSNRTRYPSQSYGAGRVYCEFELLGGGAAATLTMSTDAANVVKSITRSGTGVFVVTMKDAFNKCVYKSGDADDTANDGAYCTIGNLTNEGTSTPLVFTLYFRAAAGTAADPAAARRIGVTLVLRDGSGWGQT